MTLVALGLVLAQSPDWADKQNVHPLGLAMLLIASAAMLFVRRRQAALPLLMIAMFVTIAQRVVVATLDFSFLRILIMVGWARIFVMSEMRGFRWRALDTTVVWWSLANVFATVVRCRDEPGMQIVYSLGWTVDNLGCYLLFRLLLRSREEVYSFIRWAALLSVPVAICFLVELSTHHNLFAVFGGVHPITAIREGKLRCMGAFQHPILAGCFFAGLFPMLAVLWRGTAESKPRKALAIASMVSSIIVVGCCASSTPLLSLVAGMAAMALFLRPKVVPVLRWATVFGLIGLHMVMKAPVWHLVARIDIVGGSTGDHRYRLIDATIRNFDEWCLVGVKSTAHWGWHLFDVTGHFVLQCVNGGLATFLLFLVMIALAFRSVPRVRKLTRDPRDQWLVWVVAAGLFSNCISFLGVSYDGKPLMLMHLQFAMLASLEAYAVRTARAPVPAERSELDVGGVRIGAMG